MSIFSDLANKIAPIAAVIPSPVQPFAAGYTTVKGIQNASKAKIQNQRAIAQFNKENMNMAIDFSDFASSTPRVNVAPASTANAGFGSGFGTFVGDVGRNILSPISNVISGLGFGNRPQSVIQQPASTTTMNIGAQETQRSGTNEAFLGGGFAPLIQGASRLLSSRGGQIATAVGGGLVGSMFQGQPSSMRITRKTKRLAQQAYGLAMGDLGSATVLFGQLSGLQINEQQFVLILTKRFRNDGAVVTKAALRKTRTTVRRLKGMSDMLDSLRPSATRRKTPVRRTTTTLIKN
tara:strand:+ start:36 stop:911 length:876 start_codon:yes stop_codon:yes gene_type:complete